MISNSRCRLTALVNPSAGCGHVMGRSALLLGMTLLFSVPAFSQGITLDQAIRETCANSDSVKMMRESVKKAGEMVREKWSNVYPVVSASVVTAKNRGSMLGGGSSGGSSSRQIALASAADAPTRFLSLPADTIDPATLKFLQQLPGMLQSFSEPQTSTIYSAGLSVSQPIYTFGKVGTAIKVAEQYNESVKMSFKRNMQTLQLAALDAFYRTRLAWKAGEIAERSLSRKRELNEFLESNFKLGSGSKAQVLATRADALNQSSIALIAKHDARTARMFLNVLMGRPLTETTPLDTNSVPAPLLEAAPAGADTAIRTALDARMDLKSLRLLAESNKGGAKIFKAMYLPSIGAQGSLGYSKYESGSSFMKNDGTGNWSIGLGLNWTLFDGFANSAKAAQFLSDAHKLDIACSSIEKLVEIEIRSAIEECHAADSNWAACREMFDAALESYDLTNSNFKQGSGQLADLQRVDELLQQAELGLTNASYRQVRSRAALIVAMGRDIVNINGEEQ